MCTSRGSDSSINWLRLRGGGHNGTFRREVLNANVFGSVVQVRQLVDEWVVEYNTERPHQALGFMTLADYRQAAQTPV